MTTEYRQKASSPGGGPPPGRPPGDSRIGKTIGQCLIQQKLGHGGMGTVYLARHLTLNKPVAVKILKSDLPTDVQGVERFLREARAAARLDHPRIVHIYDAGQQKGVYYIVMQFVPGESLATRIRRELTLQIPDALQIFRAVADGIEHAHSSGIIHRDIKPDNILLGSDGSVKIVDFGLACVLEADPNLSRTGTILGSPNFMSPEQAMGQRVDKRTDVYSLGATLYQMLTGVPPFQAASAIGVVCKVVKEPLRPPHEVRPGLPMPLSRFVCQLMQKDREKRVPTMHDALSLLGRIESAVLGAEPRNRRGARPLLAGAAMVLAALLLALGYLYGPWSASVPTAGASSGPSKVAPAPGDVRTAPGGRSGAAAGAQTPGSADDKGDTGGRGQATLPPAPPPPPAGAEAPPETQPASGRDGSHDPRSLEPLARKDELALRARFEDLKGAVSSDRADLRDFIDPDVRERAPRGLKNRPLLVLHRILGDLGIADLALATVRRIEWEDRTRGIARVEAEVAGADRTYRQLWVLRGGTWYFAPRPPQASAAGDRE